MSPTQDDGMAELPKLAFSIKMLRQLVKQEPRLDYYSAVQIRPLETLKFMSVDFEMELINWGDLLVIDLIDNASLCLIMHVISHTILQEISGAAETFLMRTTPPFVFRLLNTGVTPKNHLLIANSNRCILCCANNSVQLCFDYCRHSA